MFQVRALLPPLRTKNIVTAEEPATAGVVEGLAVAKVTLAGVTTYKEIPVAAGRATPAVGRRATRSPPGNNRIPVISAARVMVCFCLVYFYVAEIVNVAVEVYVPVS